jgi:serine/threonine protein kinase/Tol biopolymer transport system component
LSLCTRTPGERAFRILREACDADEALRQEVESLLACQPRAESFLESPALEAAAKALARNQAQALVGRRLGAYEILALLGAGGMGEVYRARDTRLGRTVAVKIIPEHLSRNAQSRERFEREARATSALNHPHICSLYDVGEQDGLGYLVMEYIEGETLAARLAKDPLPLNQALTLAVQMASALAAAHSRGIVHRDFKPGNVMVNNSGAKVLDFGLAKMERAVAADATTVAEVTQKGSILGTFHYMSPEQAEGGEVDSRSDIFNFGLVLHEMLTGVKSFLRDTPASTISAVLRDEPAPLEEFVTDVPSGLAPLIGRCVRKDRAKRAQSIADIKLMLEEIQEEIQRGTSASRPQQSLSAARPSRRTRLWATAIATLALGLALGLTLTYFRQPAVEQRSVRFAVRPPPGAEFELTALGGRSISPDGRLLAFVARHLKSTSLWVLPLNALTARELPGTDGASNPFWSPDNRSLGFVASGKLKQIDLPGGSPVVICDATGLGGTWNADNIIIFVRAIYSALYRVSASGGTPAAVTKLDISAGEQAHRWPQFLPDGRRFLYYIRSSNPENQGVYLGSLDSPLKVRVLKASFNARYVPPLGAHPGYLLWVRDGSLVAQPFDARRGQITGDVVSVASPVRVGLTAGLSEFSASNDGTLVYSGGSGLHQLTYQSREGKVLNTVGTPAAYHSLKISPDGKWLAAGRNEDIWLLDFARGIQTRVTFGQSYAPVWSPDGQWIAYRAFRDGTYNLFRKRTGSAGEEERLTQTSNIQGAEDWSPDGRFLLYSEESAGKDWDLWLLPSTHKASRTSAVKTGFSGSHGQFSPDGKWIAYGSDESGRREIYVQRFPQGTFRRQISNGGGDYPRWRRIGELFYVAPDGKLMAVAVQPRLGTVEFSSPKALFGIVYPSSRTYGHTYDVVPDGKHFLTLAPAGEGDSTSLMVVLNWQAELR